MKSKLELIMESELIQELEDFCMCEVNAGVASRGDILQFLPEVNANVTVQVNSTEVQFSPGGSLRWYACT